MGCSDDIFGNMSIVEILCEIKNDVNYLLSLDIDYDDDITKIEKTLIELEARLKILETIPEIDFSPLRTEIISIKNKIKILEEEPDVPLIDFTPLEEEIIYLKSELTNLKNNLLNELTAFYEDLELNFSSINTEIEGIANDIEIGLTEIHSNIDGLNSRLDLLNTEIDTDLNLLETTIKDTETRLDNRLDILEGAIGEGGEVDLSEIQESINVNKNNISSLQTSLNNLQTELNTVNYNTNINTDLISNLNTDVNSLDVDVNTIQQSINNINSNINNINNELNHLDEMVNNFTSQIALNTININNLDSDVNTINNEVNQVQRDMGYRKTLWVGSVSRANDIINLNESIDNFDVIQIRYFTTGEFIESFVFKDTITKSIRQINLADSLESKIVEFYEINLKRINATRIDIITVKRINNEGVATATPSNTSINEVYGIKYGRK